MYANTEFIVPQVNREKKTDKRHNPYRLSKEMQINLFEKETTLRCSSLIPSLLLVSFLYLHCSLFALYFFASKLKPSGLSFFAFACWCLVLFLVTPTPTRNEKFSRVTNFGKAPHSIIIVSVWLISQYGDKTRNSDLFARLISRRFWKELKVLQCQSIVIDAMVQWLIWEKRVRTSRINGSDEQGLPSRPNEIFKTRIPWLQLLTTSHALGINIHCFFRILDYKATRFNIEYSYPKNNNNLWLICMYVSWPCKFFICSVISNKSRNPWR